MEMEQNWFKEYSWATYIDWELPKSDEYRRLTQEAAAFLGWNYDELKGDPRLIRDLLNGKWDDEDFLKVAPPARSSAPPTMITSSVPSATGQAQVCRMSLFSSSGVKR